MSRTDNNLGSRMGMEFGQEDMQYTYRVTELPSLYHGTQDVFTNSSNSFGENRLRVSKNGIKFAFKVTGEVGRFVSTEECEC